MTKEKETFKGLKSFDTDLGGVPVRVGYKYDETWEDFEITSIITEEGTELITLLDVVTDIVYHDLISEIYELENE